MGFCQANVLLMNNQDRYKLHYNMQMIIMFLTIAYI